MKTIRTLALASMALFAAYAISSCASQDDTAEMVQFCAECGVEEGGDNCCDADAERCDCGMIKGAAGCCK